MTESKLMDSLFSQVKIGRTNDEFKRVCKSLGGEYSLDKEQEEHCVLPSKGTLSILKTPEEFAIGMIIPRNGKSISIDEIERKKFTPAEELEEFKALQLELAAKGMTLTERDVGDPTGRKYVPRRAFALTDKTGKDIYYMIDIGRGEIPYSVKLRGLLPEIEL